MNKYLLENAKSFQDLPKDVKINLLGKVPSKYPALLVQIGNFNFVFVYKEDFEKISKSRINPEMQD